MKIRTIVAAAFAVSFAGNAARRPAEISHFGAPGAPEEHVLDLNSGPSLPRRGSVARETRVSPGGCVPRSQVQGHPIPAKY